MRSLLPVGHLQTPKASLRPETDLPGQESHLARATWEPLSWKMHNCQTAREGSAGIWSQQAQHWGNLGGFAEQAAGTWERELPQRRPFVLGCVAGAEPPSFSLG